MDTNRFSIVIVTVGRGYVASLRFADRRNDVELSSVSKVLLYSYIERHLDKLGLLYG